MAKLNVYEMNIKSMQAQHLKYMRRMEESLNAMRILVKKDDLLHDDTDFMQK